MLGAARPTVLQMLPKDREYDLEMVKQVPAAVSPFLAPFFPLSPPQVSELDTNLCSIGGTPDQTFSFLRGDTRRSLAVVELKSSGIVKAMLPVIRLLFSLLFSLTSNDNARTDNTAHGSYR